MTLVLNEIVLFHGEIGSAVCGVLLSSTVGYDLPPVSVAYLPYDSPPVSVTHLFCIYSLFSSRSIYTRVLPFDNYTS